MISSISSSNLLDTTLAASNVKTITCVNKNVQSIEEIIYFKSLEYIDLQKNKIDSLPNINKLKNLTYIDLSNNNLSQIPNLEFNKKITDLILYSNKITKLPPLDSLRNIIYLDVVDNQLTKLPSLKYNVKIERLICAKNLIDTIPNLSSLTNMKALDISYNQINNFPDISNCVSLITLNINNNLLTQLPANFPKLNTIQKIFLGNNYLTFSELNKLLVYPNYNLIFSTFPQFHSSNYISTKKLRGDSLKIETQTDKNTNGVYYTWYKNGFVIGAANLNYFKLNPIAFSDSGTYVCVIQSTLFPNISYTNDTLHLIIKDCVNKDSINIQQTHITCVASGTLQITSNIKFNYQLINSELKDTINSNSGIFNSLNKSNYNLIVFHPNGCFINYGKIEIIRDECDQVLITPNDDGDADDYYFSQTGNVKIYNKRGDLVKSMQIPGTWDATSKTGKISQGFYVADINNGEKSIKISVVY